MNTQPRLQQKYLEVVRPALKEKLNCQNVMQVPKIEKIVINVGMGDAIKDGKLLDAAVEELTMITGQKPSIRKAKKSVSNFKLREGMKIGACVTMRGQRMYEFFDRLVTVVMPRIRDFQGFSSKSFDGRGNYNFGLTEQTVFPEIKFDSVLRVNGMNVTIVTSSPTDAGALELLKEMGFPFKKN